MPMSPGSASAAGYIVAADLFTFGSWHGRRNGPVAGTLQFVPRQLDCACAVGPESSSASEGAKAKVDVMEHQPWDLLGEAYDSATVRQDSLDTLVEYPAQKRAIGDVLGKSVLDLGCGSGRKAFDFVREGARRVVGIDISSHYASVWKSRGLPANLHLVQGDINALDDVDEIAGQMFDIVTCFQVLGYCCNLEKTFRSIRVHVGVGGRFVFMTAHPFRYAIEKHDRDGVPYGIAYRDESLYSYPATWDGTVTVSHRKPMISTYVNALLRSGFRLDSMEEPDLSDEQKLEFPEKAAWVAKYVGSILYQASAE